MIRLESPARVEADPARDQPPHAPPTPNSALKSGGFLSRAPEPGSGREQTPGSVAASRATRLPLAANASAPRAQEHTAEERLSTNTQAREGLFVSTQALA